MKVEKLIDKAIQEIEDALKKTSSSHAPMQLEKIKGEIKNMKSAMSPNNYQPSFPRMIVDSWDHNDQLGILLLGMSQEYKKLDK